VSIHDETLDQQNVLDVVEKARNVLERESESVRLDTCDALGIGSEQWAACRAELVEQLQEAEEWLEREQVLRTVSDAPIDSDDGPEFIPGHQTLALVQSAMEEQLDRGPHRRFFPRDPKWLSVLYQRLRSRARGKAPFPQHERLSDFRFDLPPRCRVALVSDWGTGNSHAIAVAAQIRERRPDHVIHLGDVYYSGTPREMQKNFLEVWVAHGPRQARYWALNANHDMYSGGYGYFQHVLPAFGQPASYFNLQNAHWRLVGLDSGYVNHNLHAPQTDWLSEQLGGAAKTILLTHHHLLSPFRKRGDLLEEQLDPYLSGGRLFAWIWGHDHHLIEFADYRGVKCRCIGHGSLPYVPPDQRRARHDVPVVRMETRPAPESSSKGMHGYALLTFDGPVLDIEYVDEAGGTAWTERWD
jgi:Calcineurin-like phosphoesterase